MIGYRETDTLGNKIFVATSCEFCQMDTAGNHDYGCPNREPIGVICLDGEIYEVETINPVKTEPPNTTIEYREPVEGSG